MFIQYGFGSSIAPGTLKESAVQTLAQLKPGENNGPWQMGAGTIAGSAMRRNAMINAASEFANADSFASVANQGTAGLAAVAQDSGDALSWGLQAGVRQSEAREARRFAGRDLAGMALIGAGTLYESLRGRAPRPQRQMVEAPTFTQVPLPGAPKENS